LEKLSETFRKRFSRKPYNRGFAENPVKGSLPRTVIYLLEAHPETFFICSAGTCYRDVVMSCDVIRTPPAVPDTAESSSASSSHVDMSARSLHKRHQQNASPVRSHVLCVFFCSYRSDVLIALIYHHLQKNQNRTVYKLKWRIK